MTPATLVKEGIIDDAFPLGLGQWLRLKYGCKWNLVNVLSRGVM